MKIKCGRSANPESTLPVYILNQKMKIKTQHVGTKCDFYYISKKNTMGGFLVGNT